MIGDIFLNEKIEYFAAVPASTLRPGNRRLYDAVPDNANVIFVLFPYYVCSEKSLSIAHFAAVPDYHIYAKNIFSYVSSYAEEKYPGCLMLGFSDHSPFAEIAGAAGAGLGIIGENSLLINEKYSSFVCIGELVTDLSKKQLEAEKIPFGSVEQKHCENCGACKTACPGACCGRTERITCLSAINQTKSDLSADQADAIKESGVIWGCDICQTVCPHSKKALRDGTIETPIEFFKEGFLGENAVSEILSMDDETYNKYPFSWRKRDIIKRNIKIVFGNGDSSDG